MFLAGDILSKSQIQKFEIDESQVHNNAAVEEKTSVKDDNGACEYLPEEIKPVYTSTQSAKTIVDEAIKQGYTAEKATVVYRAQKAYESTGGANQWQAKTSSYKSYTVTD